MANTPQRVVIPFNAPLAPGAPANEAGIQKVENLISMWGGLRSVPVPSGTEVVITTDEAPELSTDVGVSTELANSIVALGAQKSETVSFFNDGQQTFSPSSGERLTFDNAVTVVGVRNNIFVDDVRYDLYENLRYELSDPTDVNPSPGESVMGGSAEAVQWKLAQFGDYVVCSNYADPVLRLGLREDTDPPYSLRALINTLTKPRAKHMTVVGGHVLLGNLFFGDDTDKDTTNNPLMLAFTTTNSDGVQEVKDNWPNAIWWSAQNDASFFSSPANANAPGSLTEAGTSIESLSDFEIIYDVPGEITGLIGFPEAAVIFTKFGSSLLRLTRGPEVFERNVLELGVGCTSPQSLVSVDQDVYFFSQDGFRVLSSFQKSRSIMPESLRREILDNRFSTEYSIDADSIKFSMWDPAARNILWWYENLDDELVAVTYSVDTEQWGFIRSSEFNDFFVGCGTPEQRPWSGLYLTKKSTGNANEVVTTRWRDGESDDEIETTEATVRTKTFSLTPDQGQVGTSTAWVTRVRPIFRHYSDANPQVIPVPEIKLFYSRDPNLRVDEKEVTTFSATPGSFAADWQRPDRRSPVGSAFEIEVTFPKAFDQVLWDLTGVQVEYIPGGET